MSEWHEGKTLWTATVSPMGNVFTEKYHVKSYDDQYIYFDMVIPAYDYTSFLPVGTPDLSWSKREALLRLYERLNGQAYDLEIKAAALRSSQKSAMVQIELGDKEGWK